MVSIYIFCKNVEYTNYLTKKISHLNKINILGSSTKLTTKVFNLCQHTRPNILITDDNYKKQIQKNFHYNYHIITISQTDELSTRKVLNIINKFINDYKMQYKLNISNLKQSLFLHLYNYNFNNNLCGTEYILDYISYCYENPYLNILNNRLSNNIVKALSNKYSINLNSIVWNISSSIGNPNKLIDLNKNFKLLEDTNTICDVAQKIC